MQNHWTTLSEKRLLLVVFRQRRTVVTLPSPDFSLAKRHRRYLMLGQMIHILAPKITSCYGDFYFICVVISHTASLLTVCPTSAGVGQWVAVCQHQRSCSPDSRPTEPQQEPQRTSLSDALLSFQRETTFSERVGWCVSAFPTCVCLWLFLLDCSKKKKKKPDKELSVRVQLLPPRLLS